MALNARVWFQIPPTHLERVVRARDAVVVALAERGVGGGGLGEDGRGVGSVGDILGLVGADGHGCFLTVLTVWR